MILMCITALPKKDNFGKNSLFLKEKGKFLIRIKAMKFPKIPILSSSQYATAIQCSRPHFFL